MLDGRTLDQKRKMVKSVTEAICTSLSVPDSAVTVIISEMPKAHLAKAGKLLVVGSLWLLRGGAASRRDEG
jgi:4-oxalocrotonate tautomerase